MRATGSYRHVPLADVQRFEVRRRTGTHVKRGAVMGVFLWASLMFAASIDRLEDAGPASWESAALLAGSVGLGAVVGKGVPRYGWVAAEPGRLTGSLDPPPSTCPSASSRSGSVLVARARARARP